MATPLEVKSPTGESKTYEGFPFLKMEQRLEILRKAAAKGWIYPVGSLPSVAGFAGGQGVEFAADLFRKRILPQIKKTGVIPIFQKSGAKEHVSMNQEAFYHPDLGLILAEEIGYKDPQEHWDDIVLRDGVKGEEVLSEVIAGLDYDAEAMPSWQVIQTHQEELRKLDPQIIKTQFTSLDCAAFNLSLNVRKIQEQLMQILTLTHLQKASEIAPVVCVSVDNPGNLLAGLKKDLEVMFGMNFASEQGGVTNWGLADALNIVLAAHFFNLY